MKNERAIVSVFVSSHYDVAFQKTFAGYLDRSLGVIDAALKLLDTFPDYVFVVEQVIILREYLERHPQQAEAVRKFAQAGRLVVAPGMFTMPDTNMPSGESFVRNCEIGLEWLRAHLGIAPAICWMPDPFGHHPQMPQIAVRCGYSSYMFERGKTGGDETLFWWEGLDGTRILTQWEINTYNGLGIPLSRRFRVRGPAWISEYVEKSFLNPLQDHSPIKDDLLVTLGGDFRLPCAEDVEFLDQFNRRSRRFTLRLASPAKYFDRMRNGHSKTLTIHKADFNPLMVGTYSTRIRLKQANRRLENLVCAVEMIETAVPDGKPGAGKHSEYLGEILSWNAFHDIICGSLEDSAFREALQDYDRAERVATRALREGILAAAGRSPCRNARNAASAVSFFNSLPHRRSEWVEIPLPVGMRAGESIELIGADGARIPAQRLSGANPAILASVPMPPAAIRSFAIVARKGGAGRGGPRLIVKDNLLENALLRAEFAPNGSIVSLVDKESGAELASPVRSSIAWMGMNSLLRQPDWGDPWIFHQAPNNGNILHAEALRDPMPESGLELQRQGPRGSAASDADAVGWPEASVVESGPLRAALQFASETLGLTTRISLARDEKMLRFTTRFVPRGKRYRLRAAFPTSIKGGRIRFSIPCGCVERGEGEYPAQGWIDYADGEKGLCLLNRGMPGNNVTDGVMMLSLFRAVALESVDAERASFEEGVQQTFEYALRPFAAGEKSYNPARLAAEFNRPYYAAFPDKGAPLPQLPPLLEFVGENVELMRLCAGDEPGAYNVSFFEDQGQSGPVKVRFSFSLRRCRRTDFRGAEMAGSPITVARNTVSLVLKPFEIVNLRVERNP